MCIETAAGFQVLARTEFQTPRLTRPSILVIPLPPFPYNSQPPPPPLLLGITLPTPAHKSTWVSAQTHSTSRPAERRRPRLENGDPCRKMMALWFPMYSVMGMKLHADARRQLAPVHPRKAAALPDPANDPGLFPGLDYSFLRTQSVCTFPRWLRRRRVAVGTCCSTGNLRRGCRPLESVAPSTVGLPRCARESRFRRALPHFPAQHLVIAGRTCVLRLRRGRLYYSKRPSSASERNTCGFVFRKPC